MFLLLSLFFFLQDLMLTVCIIPSRCAIISSLLEGPDPQPALPTSGPARALLWGCRRWRRRWGRWQWRALSYSRLTWHPLFQPLQPGRAPPAAAGPGWPPWHPLSQQRRRARRKDPVGTAGRGGAAAGPTSEGGADRARWGGLQLPKPWREWTGHQALRGSGLSLLLDVLLWDVPVTRRGRRYPLQGLWEHRVPGGGRGQRGGVPTQLRPTQEGVRRGLLWGCLSWWGGWRGGGGGKGGRAKQPMTPLFSPQCLVPPPSLEGFFSSQEPPHFSMVSEKFEPLRMSFFFLLWPKSKSSVFALLAAFQLLLSTS